MKKASLDGKPASAFGSYTNSGDATSLILVPLRETGDMVLRVIGMVPEYRSDAIYLY
jgi:hypothetical protein